MHRYLLLFLLNVDHNSSMALGVERVKYFMAQIVIFYSDKFYLICLLTFSLGKTNDSTFYWF